MAKMVSALSGDKCSSNKTFLKSLKKIKKYHSICSVGKKKRRNKLLKQAIQSLQYYRFKRCEHCCTLQMYFGCQVFLTKYKKTGVFESKQLYRKILLVSASQDKLLNVSECYQRNYEHLKNQMHLLHPADQSSLGQSTFSTYQH